MTPASPAPPPAAPPASRQGRKKPSIERRLVRLAFWRHDCRCGCRWRPLLGRRSRHTATCGWCAR